MKILITDPIAPSCIDILKREPGIEVDVRVGLSSEELCRVIPPYIALIVRSGTRVTAEVLEAAENLRIVGRAGAGVDNIDVAAATKRGIIVMNTPGGNTVSTAEHTFSMLLALSRNIPQAAAAVRRGEWERRRYTGVEVRGKTIGVIGLGRIGREVAAMARAFGMKVLGYDPLISEDVADRLNVQLIPLDEIYGRADYLTIHVPLNEQTRHMIGERELSSCRQGVRIVNCARGGIIDEEALLRAIERGIVAGVALDVFEQEPPPKDHPLLHREEVICTPHLGAATEEAQATVALQIAEQVADALMERTIRNAVNLPSIDADLYARIRPYLDLGEKIGSLQAQLGEGQLTRLSIEYHGEVLNYATAPITSAVLKGVMQTMCAEAVTYVNAPLLAQERGVRIDEVRSQEHEDFTTLVTVVYETTAGRRAISGTIFGKGDPRIVRIDDFHLDAQPGEHMLILGNQDVPGVVGRVGTILAENQINIASMALGRERPGGQAVTVLNIDSPVSDAALAQLCAQPQILWAKRVKV